MIEAAASDPAKVYHSDRVDPGSIFQWTGELKLDSACSENEYQLTMAVYGVKDTGPFDSIRFVSHGEMDVDRPYRSAKLRVKNWNFCFRVRRRHSLSLAYIAFNLNSDLADNPLVCNCSVRWLTKVLRHPYDVDVTCLDRNETSGQRLVLRRRVVDFRPPYCGERKRAGVTADECAERLSSLMTCPSYGSFSCVRLVTFNPFKARVIYIGQIVYQKNLKISRYLMG